MKTNTTHNTVLLELSNPFNDDYGVVEKYTVIVSKSKDKPGKDLFTYAEMLAEPSANVHYAAVFECDELFADGGDSCWQRRSRRRRASEGEVCIFHTCLEWTLPCISEYIFLKNLLSFFFKKRCRDVVKTFAFFSFFCSFSSSIRMFIVCFYIELYNTPYESLHGT